MKNMIEVPSEKDFYRTKNVELTNEHNGLQKVHYRDCNIAMRSITDFTSIENEVEVIDQDKMPEFDKEVEEFNEKCKAVRTHNIGTEFHMMPEIERPVYPTKKVKIIGTAISYYNTVQRIIVDDFEDFEKEYFNYLKMSRLDLGIEK